MNGAPPDAVAATGGMLRLRLIAFSADCTLVKSLLSWPSVLIAVFSLVTSSCRFAIGTCAAARTESRIWLKSTPVKPCNVTPEVADAIGKVPYAWFAVSGSLSPRPASGLADPLAGLSTSPRPLLLEQRYQLARRRIRLTQDLHSHLLEHGFLRVGRVGLRDVGVLDSQQRAGQILGGRTAGCSISRSVAAPTHQGCPARRPPSRARWSQSARADWALLWLVSDDELIASVVVSTLGSVIVSWSLVELVAPTWKVIDAPCSNDVPLNVLPLTICVRC